tara:strand:- start:182 stop:322 length:141 start_codon:yes stop_codon:yes gene_type:complete
VVGECFQLQGNTLKITGYVNGKNVLGKHLQVPVIESNIGQEIIEKN